MANLQTLTRRARHLAKVNGHRLERMNRYNGSTQRDAECIDCKAIAWVDPNDPKGMGGYAIVDACPTHRN